MSSTACCDDLLQGSCQYKGMRHDLNNCRRLHAESGFFRRRQGVKESVGAYGRKIGYVAGLQSDCLRLPKINPQLLSHPFQAEKSLNHRDLQQVRSGRSRGKNSHATLPPDHSLVRCRGRGMTGATEVAAGPGAESTQLPVVEQEIVRPGAPAGSRVACVPGYLPFSASPESFNNIERVTSASPWHAY